LDVHVRYVCDGKVKTQYWDSVFLNKMDAKTLARALGDSLKPIKRRNMVQLSLDGPNVNKALLRLWNEECTDMDIPKLLDTGICQLHVVHGALQAGHAATGWKLNEFLCSCYYLFSDSPRRRGDFVSITGQSEFPLKFCPHRWVENTTVIQRVVKFLPHLRKYVKEVSPKPSVPCFAKIVAHLNDTFLEAKLGFFQGISSVMETFLMKYQTNDPLFFFSCTTTCVYWPVTSWRKSSSRRSSKKWKDPLSRCSS
jgi:hypothetical protein